MANSTVWNYPEFNGKTVESIWRNVNGSGDPFVTITFTDKTYIRIEEMGQTGWIDIETGVEK
jgi:hypothetical protein